MLIPCHAKSLCMYILSGIVMLEKLCLAMMICQIVNLNKLHEHVNEVSFMSIAGSCECAR